jgi:hypothetical protein
MLFIQIKLRYFLASNEKEKIVTESLMEEIVEA